MVRLKAALRLDQYRIHAGFNSLMVRLKEGEAGNIADNVDGFNSLMVRLKALTIGALLKAI